MTDEGIKKKLDLTEKGMLEMVTDGVMERDEYHKFLVIFAHDHANNNDLRSAVTYLQKLPHEYLDGVMLDHLNENDYFVDIAFKLAETLVEEGIVSLDQQFYFTQPPAKA